MDAVVKEAGDKVFFDEVAAEASAVSLLVGQTHQFSCYTEIWGKKKKKAANSVLTLFRLGGRICQSKECAYVITKYSVLQTPAPKSASLRSIFN